MQGLVGAGTCMGLGLERVQGQCDWLGLGVLLCLCLGGVSVFVWILCLGMLVCLCLSGFWGELVVYVLLSGC